MTLQVVSDMPEEARRRYEDAKARRDLIYKEWEARDFPLLDRGSTNQLVEHPLVKMLREHDSLLQKLSEPLRKRHAGPEPSAVFKGSIGESPAAKLRQVK